MGMPKIPILEPQVEPGAIHIQYRRGCFYVFLIAWRQFDHDNQCSIDFQKMPF